MAAVGELHCRWTTVDQHRRHPSHTLQHRAACSKLSSTSGGWFGRRTVGLLSSQRSSSSAARYAQLLQQLLMITMIVTLIPTVFAGSQQLLRWFLLTRAAFYLATLC